MNNPSGGLLRSYRMQRAFLYFLLGAVVLPGRALANEPVAMYIFPAGGQRGTEVDVRVGGLFFHGECAFQMLGEGVEGPSTLRETETVWFEGPVIPLPASQRSEDYPKDHAGGLKIAADASLGVRYWRTSTSQGATPARMFVVGDLPEVVEEEIDGEPIPVPVQVPVTINGRIFPREDVDSWSVKLKARQTVQAEVHAARLGSPLDSRLEVLDPHGNRLAENGGRFGADAFLRFTAPTDGSYQIRIHDLNFAGLQHFVYRLTLTTGPHVDAIYPLGGRRGSEVILETDGHALPARGLKVSLPADAPSVYAHRLQVDEAAANTILLETDDLPEALETEPNDQPEQAPPASVPVVFNGRIGQPADVDYWSFAAAKGEACEIEVRASRLGSPLDSVLTLLDAAGKQLAQSDDLSGDETDSLLRFTAPAEGVYRLRIEERLSSRGGSRYAYRLRVAPASKPGFRLTLPADALSLPRGSQANLKLAVERLGGFSEAITLEFDGLPEGVTATPATIGAKQNQVQIAFKAENEAKVQLTRLTIRGTAEIDGQKQSHAATLSAPRGLPELDHLLLAVAMPAPFKVTGVYNLMYAPRGTVHRRRYTIERGGYEGPLEISLADRQARHLQGVTGPTITVPAGQSEFEYPVFLAPWLEIGRTSRTVIMAVGVVEDAEGRKHTVSQSTPNQNEQIVILTDPGLLSVQPERTSLLAMPGGSAELTVRVERAQSVKLPVTVELIVPPHISGVEATPLVLAADQSQGKLRLRFGQDPGPLNISIVVRATAMDGEDPIVAECKIELVTQ